MVETLQEKDTTDPDARAQGLGRTQNLARNIPRFEERGAGLPLCFGSLLSLPEAGGKTYQSTSWAPMRSCTW